MLLPLLASLLVVFGAPYVGEIRSALQTSFPDEYRLIVGAIVTITAAAAVAWAVAGVRRPQRATSGLGEVSLRTRYALVIAAVAISAAYAGSLFLRNPDVALVESFHFVEYGAVAWLFYRAWRGRPDVSGVAYAACAGVAVGVADESVQWFVPGRVGEMHDIVLNAVAVGCGLLAAAAVHPPASLVMPERRRSRLVLGAAIAVLLVAVAAFVDRVHVGYEIVDVQAGTFRSRYDAPDLLAAAADREARWKVSPPPDRGFSREDHYLSEGRWHAQERNAAAATHDWPVAWGENLILERFYEPVLDYGNRWPPEQRAEIEQHVTSANTNSYVSDAAPYPIYRIPRMTFWLVTALGVMAVVWCFGRRGAVAEASLV